MPMPSRTLKQRPATRQSAPTGQPSGLTQAQSAYHQVEELIVTLQLPPGQPVSEMALAQRTGVGRTPMREALQRLAREGLVQIHPRRGILITEINIAHQLGHLEVRRALEPLVAQGAALRATPEQRTRLRELAAEMIEAAQADDSANFMRLDAEFHRLSIEAATNETLRTVMQLLHGLSRRFWFAYQRQVGDMETSARLHGALMRAIAAGDPERAQRATNQLMDYTAKFTRMALDAGPPARPPQSAIPS